MTSPILGLVPAAGGGSRFGTTCPKQYADLEGAPLLARTLERLGEAIVFDALYVAVAPDDREAGALAAAAHAQVVACGGATRAQTVRNAVEALAERHSPEAWVLVHDAARPCVPVDALRRLLAALQDEQVGALLATPVTDTLKRGTPAEESRVLRTEDRSALWQAQTPQAFRLELLREALALPGAELATDEAQAVEALAARGRCGMPRLVPGSSLNIKVTYAADLPLAAAIRRLQTTPP